MLFHVFVLSWVFVFILSCFYCLVFSFCLDFFVLWFCFVFSPLCIVVLSCGVVFCLFIFFFVKPFLFNV